MGGQSVILAIFQSVGANLARCQLWGFYGGVYLSPSQKLSLSFTTKIYKWLALHMGHVSLSPTSRLIWVCLLMRLSLSSTPSRVFSCVFASYSANLGHLQYFDNQMWLIWYISRMIGLYLNRQQALHGGSKCHFWPFFNLWGLILQDANFEGFMGVPA